MITARPNAPLGEVHRPTTYSVPLFTPGSVVLCRNTAPLVSLCYNLLSRDVPCRIAGKDIGAGLAALARSFNVSTISDFYEALDSWHRDKVRKALEESRSPEAFTDKHDALLCLAQDVTTVAALCARIDRVFADDGSPGVLLSTIHKAKGGEWEKVFLLDFEKLLPSKYATRPWQLEQERNLQYVAVTRSKHALYFIESGKWDDAETTESL